MENAHGGALLLRHVGFSAWHRLLFQAARVRRSPSSPTGLSLDGSPVATHPGEYHPLWPRYRVSRYSATLWGGLGCRARISAWLNRTRDLQVVFAAIRGFSRKRGPVLWWTRLPWVAPQAEPRPGSQGRSESILFAGSKNPARRAIMLLRRWHKAGRWTVFAEDQKRPMNVCGASRTVRGHEAQAQAQERVSGDGDDTTWTVRPVAPGGGGPQGTNAR